MIRSLNRGGAERQLALLAAGLLRYGYQVKIAVFYSGGAFESVLRSSGVDVVSLEKKGRWEVFGFVFRLYRLLRKERPHALYAFMGIASIFAVIMRVLFPGVKVVMGVRSSYVEFGKRQRIMRVAYWLECRMSRWADLIICNSHAGKAYSARHGFSVDKMIVVPNGIDTTEFSPDPEGRKRLRAEWKIGEGDLLVGLVGRVDPMKDHETFLRALSIVVERRSDVRAICVGSGAEPYKTGVMELAAALRLHKVIIWAGERDDMPAVYSALDAMVSTSLGEGFSNTIAEAMACSVPCVVTSVGDSAMIVGDVGIVVPPRAPDVIAAGLERMLTTLGAARRVGSRRRIEKLFGVNAMIANTDAALRNIL